MSVAAAGEPVIVLHRWLIDGLQEHPAARLPRTLRVTTGHPFAAGDLSEPKPDLAVVRRGSYGRTVIPTPRSCSSRRGRRRARDPGPLAPDEPAS